jgi:hypothetical protein
MESVNKIIKEAIPFISTGGGFETDAGNMP